MTRGLALIAVLAATSCATPLSSGAPARTLAEGNWALGSTVGMAAPSAGLTSKQRAREPRAALSAALASGGFSHAFEVRRGLSRGFELGLSQGGAGQLEIGARYALARPDNGWDLTVGGRALGAWAAPDAGRRDLDIDSYSGAGGALTLMAGRTWSDFVSVWLGLSATVQSFGLEASVDSASADFSGLATLIGGAVGLRVGYRVLFAAIELALHRLEAAAGDEGLGGWLLVPSFGLSVETR